MMHGNENKVTVKDMKHKQKFRPNPDVRLLAQVREVLRYHHYAYRTEQTYCEWIVRAGALDMNKKGIGWHVAF